MRVVHRTTATVALVAMLMSFALAVVDTVRTERRELFDDRLEQQIREMVSEAVDCEYAFATSRSTPRRVSLPR